MPNEAKVLLLETRRLVLHNKLQDVNTYIIMRGRDRMPPHAKF